MQTTKLDVERLQLTQPTNWACIVNDYGVLTVTGADSQALLQGQTTCDFKRLNSESWTMGALCNPKGRVIFTFTALVVDSGFLLVVPISMIDTVCNRLKMYVLRSDVAVNNESESWRLIGFSSDSNRLGEIALPPVNKITVDAGNYFLGCPHRDSQPTRHMILTKVNCEQDTFQQLISFGLTSRDSGTWNQYEILNGIPTICPSITEAFTPQMLNLDLLHAISFEKGCYTGQEVVARTQHLGTLKRRMVGLTCSTEAPPEPGTKIFSSSNKTQDSVGQIVRSAAGFPNHSASDQQSMMLAVLQIIAIHNADLYLDNGDSTSVIVANIFDPQELSE